MDDVIYWQCGDLPEWPILEGQIGARHYEWLLVEEDAIRGLVDEHVGLALKEYIEEDGWISISWWNDPEPSVTFVAPENFEKKEPLEKLIRQEIEMYRPGGEDKDADPFFEPGGDRRLILMQELLRTYHKWKAGGVHVPEKDEGK